MKRIFASRIWKKQLNSSEHVKEEEKCEHDLNLNNAGFIYELSLRGNQKIYSEDLVMCRIQRINLYDSAISDDLNQIYAIAQCLETNCFLEEITISKCGIGNFGCTEIALATERNPKGSLKLLDLSYNQAIGIQGFSALGKLLKVNKSLESLNLARYWHSSGGLFCDKSFIEPLKENTTLEFLNLNEIICDSKCIAEMLKFNKTLKSLKVSRSAVQRSV
jgi:hypothetical protein